MKKPRPNEEETQKVNRPERSNKEGTNTKKPRSNEEGTNTKKPRPNEEGTNPQTQISLTQTVRFRLNPGNDCEGSRRRRWRRQSSRRRFSSNSFIFFSKPLGFDDVSLSLGLSFDDISGKSSLEDLSFMELEFVTLDLAQKKSSPLHSRC